MDFNRTEAKITVAKLIELAYSTDKGLMTRIMAKIGRRSGGQCSAFWLSRSVEVQRIPRIGEYRHSSATDLGEFREQGWRKGWIQCNVQP
ncbi:hypothetical protein [Phytopseudomonas dryadis]|uniref:hypothetical protein n=1 Tax=Pseudomonadaceae TaxID=135621 RepID=UPI00103781FD|nr:MULTISPECIES: hypothetical protein [Pseudomonas]